MEQDDKRRAPKLNEAIKAGSMLGPIAHTAKTQGAVRESSEVPEADQSLGGIAAAIGFLEGVASRTTARPTVDASIGHVCGKVGNLTDVIHP